MEANEILTSLAKLEASLNEIESAKEQVQKTVGAYASVQKQIGEYSKVLEAVSGSIKCIIDDVQSQRTSLNDDAANIFAILRVKTDEIISMQNSYISKTLESLKSTLDETKDSFLNNCRNTADFLKQNTDEEVKRLDEQIEALKTWTSSLDSLHESIKNTLSQINAIKQSISDLKLEMIKTKDTQNAILQKTHNVLNNAIAGLSNSATDIDRKIDVHEKKLEKFRVSIITLITINIIVCICSLALCLIK